MIRRAINRLLGTWAWADGLGNLDKAVFGVLFRPRLVRDLLPNGHVVHGPAVYDQPRYEVRRAEGQIEVRRAQVTYS